MILCIYMPALEKGEAVLKRLRQICCSLPNVTETKSWGHPNWRTGKKLFASWDEYKGIQCIAFNAGFPLQDVLLQDPRFFYAPYAGNRGWVCMKIDGKMDWSEIKELIQRSYSLADPKSIPKSKRPTSLKQA